MDYTLSSLNSLGLLGLRPPMSQARKTWEWREPGMGLEVVEGRARSIAYPQLQVGLEAQVEACSS